MGAWLVRNIVQQNRHVSGAWFTCETERGPEHPAESTNKGVNWHSKDVTQTQLQKPELPPITLTWHASKYKVHKLHQDVHHIHSSGAV